jgi:hypothetical protein
MRERHPSKLMYNLSEDDASTLAATVVDDASTIATADDVSSTAVTASSVDYAKRGRAYSEVVDATEQQERRVRQRQERETTATTLPLPLPPASSRTLPLRARKSSLILLRSPPRRSQSLRRSSAWWRVSGGGGLKVAQSPHQWIAVGMWIASRDYPELPFFVPMVDPATGVRLELPVSYKAMMAALSPKYTDRDRILLHVRMVQRTDAAGRLVGEVRYLCTDIAVSYHMGDNAFPWGAFHPTRLQVLHRGSGYWNSSLNRQELLDHLGIAYQKGGLEFQAPEAEPTRRFLRAILLGKGLRAACTLKPMPQGALGVPLPGTEAAAGAHPNVSVASSLQPQCALQTLPHAMHLFLAALQRSDHLWFHPSLQEERSNSPVVQHAGSPVAAAAAAASAPLAQEQFSPVPLPFAKHKSSTKAKNATNKPTTQGILPYVQFVSVPQPATVRSPALPCVHVFNTLRPEAIARIELAAAAAAALTAGHRIGDTGPHKKRKMRKPPPHFLLCEDEDMGEVETHAQCTLQLDSASIAPPHAAAAAAATAAADDPELQSAAFAARGRMDEAP